MSAAAHPFMAGGAPVQIVVSSSSQRVQVSTGRGYRQVRVVNDGTATAWIRGGDSTVTVTATAGQADTGYRVPAGVVEVLTFPSTADGLYIAAIAAGSTGAIEFTPGSGD